MLFLATGGTFDKDYNPITGSLHFPQSQLHRLLQEANLGFEYECDVILQKDSLDMTIQDRELILARCQRYSGERIVVIHGTDTMTETATYLAQHDQGHQSIVLTGAMRPVAFGHSDATFNLGFAVAMATLQTKGVYVAMNGVCFAANAVEKNREQGKFQSRDHRLLGEQETR